MNKLENEFNTFKKLTKNFKIYKVNKKTRPELYELRKLIATIPFHLLLAREETFNREKAYTVIPFTEEISLAYIKPDTPTIRLLKKRTIIIAMPFWIYLTEDFLTEHTVSSGKVSEEFAKKVVEFAESTSIEKETSGTTKEFYEKVMKILAPYNTRSIFKILEDLENSRENSNFN